MPKPPHTAHTPTPWRYRESFYEAGNILDGPHVLSSEDDGILARVYAWGTQAKPKSKQQKIDEAEANARLIVKAVNAHEALVAALESCIDALSIYWDQGNDEDADDDEALTLARAALKLATGSL